MDDAVQVREAAEGALADVEPDRLREILTGRVADAEMTPGVLTLVSARALDPDVPVASVAERAAGVQLIYEGLRLTRRLAHEEPWASLDLNVGVERIPSESRTEFSGTDDVDADMDVLAADVFVARGFYLLARTDAAGKAVETVRAFGRDQTRRRSASEPPALDRNLEADVFELAVVAGTDTVGADAPTDLLAYAAELAGDDERMPAEGAIPSSANDRIAALADERVASSVDP